MFANKVVAVALQLTNGVVRWRGITPVEVHPEEVVRDGDLFHISVLDRAVQVGRLDTALFECLVDHVGRIAAAENGVEEQAVAIAVGEAVTLVVLVAIAERYGMVDVDDDSDLGVGYVGADNRHGRRARGGGDGRLVTRFRSPFCLASGRRSSGPRRRRRPVRCELPSVGRGRRRRGRRHRCSGRIYLRWGVRARRLRSLTPRGSPSGIARRAG